MLFKNPLRQILFKLTLYVVWPWIAVAFYLRLILETLKNCHVFMNGDFEKYTGFTVCRSFNNLFYKIQALSLNKYGRDAKDPHLGLEGNYKLSNLNLTTPCSLFPFAGAPALSILNALLLWVVMHSLWLFSIEDAGEVGLVMALLLFSTTFYSNAFFFQNYSSFAWALFPLFLFLLHQKIYIFLTLLVFLLSFLSITVTALCLYTLTVSALIYNDPLLLWGILPASFKLVSHLFHLNSTKETQKDDNNVLKLIGFFQSKALYKRKAAKSISLEEFSLLLQYGFFIILFKWNMGELPALFCMSLLLAISNQKLVRFLDTQSLYMLLASVGTYEVLRDFEYNTLTFALIMLLNNPHAYLVGIPCEGLFGIPKIAKPIDITLYEKKVTEFLNIPSKSKIFIAFADPKGVYENLFQKQIVQRELVGYIAYIKEILCIPDWYGVISTNSPNSIKIWADTYDEALSKAKEFGCNYFIYPFDTKEKMNKQASLSGCPISFLDWDDLIPHSERTAAIQSKIWAIYGI
jgi:hypothetical protein